MGIPLDVDLDPVRSITVLRHLAWKQLVLPYPANGGWGIKVKLDDRCRFTCKREIGQGVKALVAGIK